MKDRPVLRRGDKGNAVTELQVLLGLVRLAGIGIGFFGPVTEDAVMAFQKAHNLPETGIVDRAMWTLLEGNNP